MNHRVLHQGLQEHFGHHGGAQGIRHLRLVLEPFRQAGLLDGHIAVDGLQLLLQGHKLPGGDRPAEDGRQVFRHHSHIRQLVDLGAPLDGVQSIVEKMGVELRLIEAQPGGAQRLLLLHRLIHMILQIRGHAVKVLRQLPQLILALHGDLDAQIPLPHPAHPLRQAADGAGDPAAQSHGDEQTERQADHRHKKADLPEGRRRRGADGGRDPVDQAVAAVRLRRRVRIPVLKLLRPRQLPGGGQQIHPLLVGEVAVGGVDGNPRGIRQDQGAPRAEAAPKQIFQAVLGEIQHQDPRPHTAGIFDGIGRLEANLSAAAPEIFRHIIVNPTGGAYQALQQALVPAEGRGRHPAVRGEALHAAHVVDGEHRVRGHGGRRLVERLVESLDGRVVLAVDEDGGRRLIQAAAGVLAVGQEAGKHLHRLPILALPRGQSLIL